MVFLALCMAAWGAFLWVDAGTAHSESLPSVGRLVAEGEGPGGPNRTPAVVALATAVGFVVIALIVGRSPRTE